MKASLQGRVIHVLVGAVAITTAITAWSQWSRLGDSWRWVLPIGSVAVAIGLVALVRRNERLAGLALLLAAVSLPTGLAFILNLLLAALALPLIVRPSPADPQRA